MAVTSVCARGLDIKSIVLVVNYKCPDEDYIHRIGRTDRAGNKRTAITLITKEEQQYSLDLVKALQTSNQPVPKDLSDLVKDFKKKVETGEAKVYTNKNLVGKGF